MTISADRSGLYVLDVEATDGTSSVIASALVTVLATDELPVAYAGEDQIIPEGRTVELDGTESYDLGGRYVVGRWRLVSAPRGSAIVVDTPDLVTEFTPDAVGDYRLELVVHNGSTESLPDEMVVFVKADPITPGDLINANFDPGQVYLFGEVGPCFTGFSHWSDPNTVVGGLVCDPLSSFHQLHPDGNLRYRNVSDQTLHQLVCDDCPDWAGGNEVPEAPMSNDLPLDTLACDGVDRPLPSNFLIGPDGRTLVQCDNEWHDEDGHTYTRPHLVSYGHDDFALGTFGALVDMTTNEEIEVKGLPAGGIFAARVRPAGFWALYLDRDGQPDELWHVDTKAASAALVGAYPALDPAFRADPRHPVALDAQGTAFQVVTHEQFGQLNTRAVARRRLDGVSDIVHEEGIGEQTLDLAWGLVTGP